MPTLPRQPRSGDGEAQRSRLGSEHSRSGTGPTPAGFTTQSCSGGRSCRGSGPCRLPRSWRRPVVPRRLRPTTGAEADAACLDVAAVGGAGRVRVDIYGGSEAMRERGSTRVSPHCSSVAFDEFLGRWLVARLPHWRQRQLADARWLRAELLGEVLCSLDV